jgi:hypothetical protein
MPNVAIWLHVISRLPNGIEGSYLKLVISEIRPAHLQMMKFFPPRDQIVGILGLKK